jgi:hypothetical protein
MPRPRGRRGPLPDVLRSSNQVASQVYTSDWLASSPIFYNEKMGRVSENVNDVIDFRNLEFHPEGLHNFLDFGFSVLGQTPVQDVRILAPCSRLTRDAAGRLRLEALRDPVDDWGDRTTREADVLERLRSKVQEWEAAVDGPIVLPTSGGYDSRLLNVLLKDKGRIRSFSYGASARQEEAHEVVYAKRLSELLGTRWEHIPLGEFHSYLDEWDALYGCSTHAHGMYHIEFYRKIRERVGEGLPLLSGIIGDGWSGNVEIAEVNEIGKTKLLGYTHGAHATSSVCRLKADGNLMAEYFARHREILRDPRRRIVEAMRFKLILLSYLLRVPKSLGFRPWSPFTDVEVAMGMLCLPAARRRKRQWQREFFERQGLVVERMGLPADIQVWSTEHALECVPLRHLDATVLCAVG